LGEESKIEKGVEGRERERKDLGLVDIKVW
jgi:hypothetical protein